MRHPTLLVAAACTALTLAASEPAAAPEDADAAMLRDIHRAALVGSPAWEQLRTLVERFPGRLAGTPAYDAAAQWAHALLQATGCDRTELQPVMVPFWERGAPETAELFTAGVRTPLAVLALGGSVATPPGGLTAAVVELPSLEAVRTADVAGRIAFFNGPMDPAEVVPGNAYAAAVGQRTRGAIEAARRGAVAVVVRSMTHALHDHPHTGAMAYAPGEPRIPAAALSTVAADRLSAALRTDPAAQLTLAIHARWHEDRPSVNVIGEIRGSEFPEKVILVGGHLDAWDITPGAHDDGVGCIQSVEVLRLLKAVGYRPRHTIRCVLFTNEENGLRGALEYARVVGERREVHLLALESDSGGFAPRGFNLGNPVGDAHIRAARWRPLFEPYGVGVFQAGRGGADVAPLLRYGYTVAGLIPDSQRYFDYHHNRIDDMRAVNRREFELGAAAMASLVYLVDRHGL